MAEADVEGEKALREWAAAQKVTSKTVDLLIKDGFNSMEAVDLLDCDDLLQSKIPRGQQKLLLKALQKGPYSPNGGVPAGEARHLTGEASHPEVEERGPAARQRRDNRDETWGPQATTYTRS